MPKTKKENVAELNQGVNYMEQPVAPEAPVAPVAETPVAPVVEQPVAQQPVQPVQGAAAQPIVNTDALKAQAGQLKDKAQTGLNAYIEKLKTDKTVLIGSIAGVAVVFILVVVLFFSVAFGGAKNVVKKYSKAMVNYDAEKMVSVYHKDMIETQYDDEDEMVEEFEEMFEAFEDRDYKIVKFKIDGDYKKYDKDDLEELAEELDDDYGIDEDDVKAARRYKVEFTIDDDGDEDEVKQKIIVAKIGGKWYYVGTE